jgi:hypothetical protein
VLFRPSLSTHNHLISLTGAGQHIAAPVGIFRGAGQHITAPVGIIRGAGQHITAPPSKFRYYWNPGKAQCQALLICVRKTRCSIGCNAVLTPLPGETTNTKRTAGGTP